VGRLGDAVSPYLASHSDQPVDWYPWGPEAFDVAKARDVPVLVSIGYHTCHWCHVMSRESFANPEIAAVINESLVAIKVDREEHPDVDALYMTQAAAFTENLGWPLNVFVTPEGHAFYAATYLPPEPGRGLPSITEVVRAVSLAWAGKREEVLASSRSLAVAITQAAAVGTPLSAMPDHHSLAAVVELLVSREDTEYGGFGGAPKFPVAPVVNFLLGQGHAGNQRALALATRCLKVYAASGLCDHVEGGFFRYSTQRDFSEPHYERMLVDNAGLLLAYSRAGMVDVAAGIVGFLRHQLRVGGALGSARDSESIIDGLPNEGGYFQRDAGERSLLSPPALDGKIVTGWNGLALEALAHAHRQGVAGDPGQLGTEIAQWLLTHHVDAEGGVVRVSRDGVVSQAPATLEDVGGLALGLCELGIATANVDVVIAARALVDRIKTDPDALAPDPVLARNSVPSGASTLPDINEGASPSAQALVALAALRLERLTGDRSYRDFAQGLIELVTEGALNQPLRSGGVLRVLSELASPAREVVVVADGATELSGTALRWQSEAGLVVVVNSEAAGRFAAAGFSLFEGRTDGSTPVAYVCEGGVCRLPTTSAAELREQLAG
jgi:uncharacterized protein YyaL (SSP411 family)